MNEIEPIWLANLKRTFNEAGMDSRIFLHDIRITTGCTLFQSKPIQPSSLGITTAQDLQLACERNEDRFNAYVETFMRSLGLQIGEDKDVSITPARVKKSKRVNQKVGGLEKGGDVNTITDGLATTIWTNDNATSDKIMQHCLPDRNPLVKFVEESIHRPNTKTGLPRIQILITIPGSEGLIGEILVMPFGMKQTYEATHSLHERVRSIKSQYPDLTKIPQTKINELQEIDARRKEEMQRGMRRCNLFNERVHRTYYQIGDVLTCYSYQPKGRGAKETAQMFAPETGKIMSADIYVNAIHSFGGTWHKEPIRRLSGRDEFIRLAAEQQIEYINKRLGNSNTQLSHAPMVAIA